VARGRYGMRSAAAAYVHREDRPCIRRREIYRSKGQEGHERQVYAEFMIPSKLTSPYPVVLVHGGGNTGAIYMQTPDGREGWAPYFLRKGFAVISSISPDAADRPTLRTSTVPPECGESRQSAEDTDGAGKIQHVAAGAPAYPIPGTAWPEIPRSMLTGPRSNPVFAITF